MDVKEVGSHSRTPAAPNCQLQAMKKQNLSKEMKQKLRQEYYGLGGAENKVGSAAAAAFVVRQTGSDSHFAINPAP
jgi:hypothetical protein